MTDDPTADGRLEAEVRDLLAGLGVQPRDLEADAAESERAAADLARILATPRVSDVRRAPHEPRGGVEPARGSRRLRVATFFAVAATIAVATVVVRPWTGSSPAMAATPAMLQLQGVDDVLDGGSEQSASAELLRLADAAEPGSPRGSGPVQRILLDSWVLTTDERGESSPARSVLTPVTSDHFVLPDGRSRVIERRGDPLDPDGRVVEPLASTQGKPSDTDETFAGPDEGPGFADRLSLDPAVLRQQLIDAPAECARTMAACLAARTTFLHYNYVLRPDTAAALWRTLAGQPGFTYLGRTRDRLDRPAVAFATPTTTKGRRQLLLADPATGDLLGSEEILVRDDADLGLDAPAVIEFIAVASSARVEADAVPDPSLSTTY